MEAHSKHFHRMTVVKKFSPHSLVRKKSHGLTLRKVLALTLFLFLPPFHLANLAMADSKDSPPSSAKLTVNQTDLMYAIDFLKSAEDQAEAANDLVNRLWMRTDVSKTPLPEPGYVLFPELDKESTVVLRVDIDPRYLQDPATLITIKNQLRELAQTFDGIRTFFHDHRQWVETFWNAQAGDPDAKLELKRYELHSLKNSEERWKAKIDTVKFPYDKKIVQTTFDRRKKLLEEEIANLRKESLAKRKAAETKWKAGEKQRQTLESAKEKLDDLLKKNDRKGVSQLIRAYLPWDSMAPTEKIAWTQWLEAIENPRTDEKGSTILFRGLDQGERLFPGTNGNPGLMSTMLTKNQGNYTRRLRSYRANREIFGTAKGAGEMLFNLTLEGKFPSLTGMMMFHAADPKGTPFISFSDFSVAKGFAQNGIVGVRIDNRRILPNSAGSIPNELERLIPLVVFPDEVLHYQEITPYDSDAGLDAAFKEREEATEKFRLAFEEKLGRKLTAAETENLEKAGWTFRDESFRTFVDHYVKPLEPTVKVPMDATYIPILDRQEDVLKGCEQYFKIILDQ